MKIIFLTLLFFIPTIILAQSPPKKCRNFREIAMSSQEVVRWLNHMEHNTQSHLRCLEAVKMLSADVSNLKNYAINGYTCRALRAFFDQIVRWDFERVTTICRGIEGEWYEDLRELQRLILELKKALGYQAS